MSDIIIFDTEYTSWLTAQATNWGDPGQEKEIIQIASRTWKKGTDWREGAAFDACVRPLINPCLSAFIKELTGISQEDVDEADVASVVFRNFAEYVGNARPWSNGRDIDVMLETASLQAFTMPMSPDRFGSMHDVLYAAMRAEVGDFTWKDYPSGRLYELLNLDLPVTGKIHNAMHDVNSLCACIEALMDRGHDLSCLWD